MKENNRPCPVCGDQIFGRIDKKFCSDQCRNTFNNERYSEQNTHVQKINRLLKKNYSILKRFNPSGKTKITRSRLLQEGFDFNYFTSLYQTKQGKVYHLVYNQSYLVLSEDLVLLVRWDENAS